MRALSIEPQRVKIYLVRHAESNNNIFLGRTDVKYEDLRTPNPSLTDKGAAQATACAAFLKRKIVSPTMGKREKGRGERVGCIDMIIFM